MNVNNPPFAVPFEDNYGNVNQEWRLFLGPIAKVLQIERLSGTTAQRPTTNLRIGMPYFDTTLGHQINLKSVSPNIWVDGTGTVV